MQAQASLLSSTSPRTWKDRVCELAERPGLLILILATTRALVYPYLGIMHDAQLYGVQVARKLSPDPFRGDLFFEHGSQDQYSLFSTLVAPIVPFVGLPVAFFLIYTLCSTLLLAAQVRLCRRILPDTIAAVVSLLILAVGDLPYGGFGIFQVHEPFLTARLPATALALWGLDFVLGKRAGIGLALLAASLLVHPLMGLPAVGFALWWWVEGETFARRCLALLGSIGATLVLLLAGWSTGRLTLMSGEWLDVVTRISPQCFPSSWLWADFIHLGFALASLTLAMLQGSTLHQKLARGALVVGLGGLALTFLAEIFPVAILLQVQPYRSLWILELLAVPLGVAQAARLWREPTPLSRLLSILLLFGLGRWRSPEGWDLSLFWPFAGVVVVAFIFIREIFYRDPSPHVRRRWASGMAGLFLASVLAGLFAIFPLALYWERLLIVTDPLSIFTVGLRATGNAIALAVGATLMLSFTFLPRAWRWPTAGLLWLLILSATGYARREVRPFDQDPDITFVRGELEHLPASAPGTGFTIYWPSDARDVWFGLQTSAYYHFAQVQGVIFQEVTAREANRRLALVRPFELRRLHYLGPLASRSRLEPWLGSEGQGRPVLPEDLRQLALEPNLDVVILPYRVGDYPARSNGRLWIYDCRDIRADQAPMANQHPPERDQAEPISAPKRAESISNVSRPATLSPVLGPSTSTRKDQR